MCGRFAAAFTGAGLGAGSVILGEAFGAAAASAGSISAALGKSALLAAGLGGAGGFAGSLSTQYMDKRKFDFKEAAKDGAYSSGTALLASVFGCVPGALNGSSIVTKNAVTITYETVFDFFASALTGSN